jgi:nitrite reductase/ring-hydroxylating ferredoxin subunit
VIVRDGAVINAFAANCPHAGAPLAEGALCHHRLVCPWHKATFRGQRRICPGSAGA